MSTESEFLAVSAAQLLQSMGRIEDCVGRLTPQQLWHRDSENENSVGNLLLHLRGNVMQWILAGVGGAPDQRDRDSEFAARAGAADVADGMGDVALLGSTIEQATAVIERLPPERLLERISVQGYDVTVLGAIYHVVEHFTGHTFQIILLTKRFTGQDLGFYRHPQGRK